MVPAIIFAPVQAPTDMFFIDAKDTRICFIFWDELHAVHFGYQQQLSNTFPGSPSGYYNVPVLFWRDLTNPILWPVSSSVVVCLSTLALQDIFQKRLSQQPLPLVTVLLQLFSWLPLCTSHFNSGFRNSIRRACYYLHFLLVQRLWFFLVEIFFCAALAVWNCIVWVAVMTKECSWILVFIPCESHRETSINESLVFVDFLFRTCKR